MKTKTNIAREMIKAREIDFANGNHKAIISIDFIEKLMWDYHKLKIKKVKLTSVSSRFCVKCNFEIKPIEPKYHSKPESGMWAGGIVDKISANYGSVLDGDMFIVAICDKCVKEANLEYVGNYIGL